METFTLGIGEWLGSVVWSRNPLVRRRDRIEGALRLAAVVVCVLAVPPTASIGTSVYHDREQAYAVQAQDARQVTAVATERGSVAGTEGHGESFLARAAWAVDGHEHRGRLEWADLPQVGDRQEIWVDHSGNVIDPPRGKGRAVGDAVLTALWAWIFVVAGVSGGLILLHRRFDQARYAEWEREFEIITEKREWGKQ
ncbi:Rv1733c family protein [Mycolicibacterium goodii]|uniref:Rv1733c family protein n=1 Tax=Mycolicibacterium goodii TaxID=134601 RepID=UPI001BDC9B11|nr:hypothetical protein [Mycolicibacterium goodii]MBU8811373.1 hypothetical protein [Mycolicibacterium goodii]MBU8831886.1 hypothetical protein [Mycolicibacterium goodii]ULN45427.1 hypothetical protein MI170_18885 [Mycolicibacterium goodii]